MIVLSTKLSSASRGKTTTISETMSKRWRTSACESRRRRLIGKYTPRQAPILDIGCGAGRTTFGLYEVGYRNIKGCDLSTSMIDAARRIARERDLPIPFDIVDATSMPYEGERFEGALFSGQGLMCIPGHERRLNALREVRRVLRPGGHFIFTTHGPRLAGLR